MAEKPVVCVTGVTGYLATEIVHQLICSGYQVHGTVRSFESQTTKDLQQLFPSVKLFEADLLKPDSFDKSMEGCTVLIHTASPFPTAVKDPQVELIEPALGGTKNVLASAAKLGIKTAVITSSGAAVVDQFPTDDGTKVWTEEDWNNTSTLTDGAYRLSKVLAEKAALEWGEHHGARVATILPTFIIGPPHTKRAEATSIKFVRDLLNGTIKEVPAAAFGLVDVRDVALAHIRAFENPNAKGRYMVTTERSYPRLEMANILRKEYPDWPIPSTQIGEVQYKGGSLLPTGRYSHARAVKELGIVFRNPETSILEMSKKLIELGVASKPQ